MAVDLYGRVAGWDAGGKTGDLCAGLWLGWWAPLERVRPLAVASEYFAIYDGGIPMDRSIKMHPLLC